jgi:rhodanese-related sulfurtransferase
MKKMMMFFAVVLLMAGVAFPGPDKCREGGACEPGKSEKKFCMEMCMKQMNGPVINTVALSTLIASRIPMVILDARSGEFDDKTRIPGARSLNEKSKSEEIAKIIPDKNTLIITYCAGLQCPASHKLFIHLKKLGYNHVLEYPLGIQGWMESGNNIAAAE